MGILSKDKITLDQLAENHADLVLHTISDESLSVYGMLLRNMGENDEINERQKREILVLEMLATTRAIQKVFTNIDEARTLLDKLYIKVYKKISEIKTEQDEFEAFLNERYKAYYQTLTADTMFSLGIGKQFADYFLGKDVRISAFTNTIEDIFISNIREDEKFLRGILSKYELIA